MEIWIFLAFLLGFVLGACYFDLMTNYHAYNNFLSKADIEALKPKPNSYQPSAIHGGETIPTIDPISLEQIKEA